MSQRNPMNERYQTDDKKGQTRKSAASAKPKTKAAASVRLESDRKPQKKGFFSRASSSASTKAPAKSSSSSAPPQNDRQKIAQLEKKYGAPKTPEYKKWRRIWWACMGVGVAAIAASLIASYFFPEIENLNLILLGFAYAGVLSALVIDGAKVRKLRREYALAMDAKKSSKEERAAEKKARAEKKAAEESDEPAPAKKGFLGFNNLRALATRQADRSKYYEGSPAKEDAEDGAKPEAASGDAAEKEPDAAQAGKKKAK